MEHVVATLAREHPAATMRYHEPPSRGDPERRGDAKAGNLNSALGVHRAELAGRRASSKRAMPMTRWRPGVPPACVGQLQADRRSPTSRPSRRRRSAPAIRSTTTSRTSTEARCSPGTPPTRCSRAGPDSSGGVRRLPTSAAFPRGTSSRTFNRASRRSARLARRVPPDCRRRGPARSGGHPGHLQAARDLGRGRHASGFLGRAARAEAAPAPPVPRARAVLPPELRDARLHGGADHRLRVRRISGRAGAGASTPSHFWPFAASLELFLAALMGEQSYERLWRARQMWAGRHSCSRGRSSTVAFFLAGPLRTSGSSRFRKTLHRWRRRSAFREKLPQNLRVRTSI